MSELANTLELLEAMKEVNYELKDQMRKAIEDNSAEKRSLALKIKELQTERTNLQMIVSQI